MRVLLVQCCHLRQLIWVAEQFQRRFPDVVLELLAIDEPEVRYHVARFPGFAAVYYDMQALDRAGVVHDRILFPLMNRGYHRIKQKAFRLPGEKFEVDYAGEETPLSAARLRRSLVFCLHLPPREFEVYYREFPLRPLGQKLLLLETAGSAVVRRAKARLQGIIPADAEVTRVVAGGLLGHWKALRSGKYDNAVVFFAGGRTPFALKVLPFLLMHGRDILIFDESGNAFFGTRRNLVAFLLQRFRHGAPYSPTRPRLLLIQTESAQYTREALIQLQRSEPFSDAETSICCREEDRPLIEELIDSSCVVSYSTRDRSLAGMWRTWRSVRHLEPDVVCGVFTGRPVFRKQKLLFFLLGVRRCLAFDANLTSYWITPRKLWRVRKAGPVRPDLISDRSRVVLVQTEAPEYVLEAARRIRQTKLYPRAEVLLLCREADLSKFADSPEIDRYLVFRRGASVRELVELLRRVRHFRADAKTAVFSGRQVFRRAKLLFFLVKAQRTFVFNSQLEGYWLTLATLRRLWRKEPLLFDVSPPAPRRVLVFESDSVPRMKRVLATLLRPHVVGPNASMTVYCSEDRKDTYLDVEQVDRVLTYSKRLSRTDFETVGGLLRSWPEVSVVVLSGRGLFLKHKLLFWIVPARRRLVFNTNLDCAYLSPRAFYRLCIDTRGLENWSNLVRFPIKLLLFLPRFLYLAGWFTVLKLKRALNTLAR